MKLLILTQVVDERDPVLGFFCRWVSEFSRHLDQVTVICLREGEHHLPDNVKVFSLGKERGVTRWGYVFNFFQLIIRWRREYDRVFIHMNQEYVLMGGWLWRFWGKKIYLWRNHPVGNWLTSLAVWLSDKVYCTSRYSYTAKFAKTEIMPVGIDTTLFKVPAGVKREPRSILFLSRMAPIKRPDLLLAALGNLAKRGVKFKASFYGDPLVVDQGYYTQLRQRAVTYGILEQVSFEPGVRNTATVDVYAAHEIFVNLSPSGMYDKTIFEAMAMGVLPLVSNKNLVGQLDSRLVLTAGTESELEEKLEVLLELSNSEKSRLVEADKTYVDQHHSLTMLARKLFHD